MKAVILARISSKEQKDGHSLDAQIRNLRLGGLMSEIGLSSSFQTLYDINVNVLVNKRPVFSCGTLFWQNREHKIWHQVKLPLRRNGAVNEVLACHVFL